MKFLRFIGPLVMLVIGFIATVYGAVTGNTNLTIIGLLLLLMYDNTITHRKLRLLEVTIMASGAVTVSMLKGDKLTTEKVDGNTTH